VQEQWWSFTVLAAQAVAVHSHIIICLYLMELGCRVMGCMICLSAPAGVVACNTATHGHLLYTSIPTFLHMQSRLDNIVSFLLPDPVGDLASLARCGGQTEGMLLHHCRLHPDAGLVTLLWGMESNRD
jgi:hypothetical protein